MNDVPSRLEFNAVLRRDFYSFVQRAFKVVEPGATLNLAPYLETLCFNLQDVASGREKRLIINIPPRHLKSLVTSVIWVAWQLALDPSKKIALICHGDNLVSDLALRCKRLIESEWFKQFAPAVRLRDDRNRTRDFETTAGGGVFAASIESGITGRGFDAMVLDDPQPANNAGSEVERQRVMDLFDGSIASRLNDQVRGTIVVLQQRLHDTDVSGCLIDRGGWRLLSLPLVAAEPADYPTYDGVWHRPVGNILCPVRFPAASIETLRARLGSQVFETQYQQSPSSVSGEEIKPEYLKSTPAVPPSASRIVVTVDTAAKALPTSDYTVFMLFATDGIRHYIFDVIRERIDVAAMRDVGARLHQNYSIERFLIEDSASGPGLYALMREMGLRADLVGVGGKDKLARLRARMHLLVEGRVFIVGDTPWVPILRDELLRFPVAKFDDQVDALILFLEHVTTTVPVRPIVTGVSASKMPTPSLSMPVLRKGEHPMRPRSGFSVRKRRF